MGREARCQATLDGVGGEVKAHLDSQLLRARGALRFDIPYGEMREVAAHDGVLRLRATPGEITLALGAGEAEKWAKAISEPKSLLDKFGVKPGMRACVRGIHDATFVKDLTARLGAAPAETLRGRFDAIFAQIDEVDKLATLGSLRTRLEPNGMLWLIAPKGKTSPVPEAVLRKAILAADLVDIKVASFSATHTAVKVVIPVALRA